MKKPIKILLASLTTLVTLLIVTVIVLPFVINPNDYKPQIIELVKKQTGRNLNIPGEIDLSVFPWLGIKLGELELSNAKGFGSQPFAKVNAVDVRIQLLPLLKKEIQIGHVELDGLKLDLQRNQNGKNNWDDLSGSPAKPSKKTTPATAKNEKNLGLAGLAVGGISIRNAQLSWQDKKNNQSARIQSLNLETGSIQADQPVNIELDTRFTSRAPDINGQIELQTTATFNLEQSSYRLNNLELTSQLQGSALPGNKLDLHLNNDSLTLNQEKQTLAIKSLELATLGLQLYADAQVSQLDKQPRYQVNIASDAFSAKAIASQLGIKLPATADQDALTKIKLSSKITGGLNNISLNPLSIQLDDSSLTGHIQVSNFKQPALRYKLALDMIDVDRYLPPATQSTTNQKPATPGTATTATTQLPLKQLRALNIKGEVKIGKLKASGVRSENVQVTTSARDGLIRLYPLSAEMYRGNYKGDIRMDVRGKTPYLSMNESLRNIHIGPLFKDLCRKDNIEGIANLSAQLTARGSEPASFRKTLNGKAHFQFKDGIVKGINLGAYQRTLTAKLEGKPLPTETGPNQTEFANINGNLQITNGLARNNDLTATLPFARIQGKGFAHLAKEVIDYTVYSKFTSEAEIKRGKTYAQINKPALPVRIKGPLTKPDISVDYGYVLKALAKKKLDKKKKEAKAKVKKKLEDKINDKLKNLFKF